MVRLLFRVKFTLLLPVLVSDPLSLCSLLCTLCSQIHPKKLGWLSNIKHRKLAHAIIISDTTCSEILNLKARSCWYIKRVKKIQNSSMAVITNVLLHSKLLLGNFFCLPPRYENWLFPKLIEADGYSLLLWYTQMPHIFSLYTEIPHQL